MRLRHPSTTLPLRFEPLDDRLAPSASIVKDINPPASGLGFSGNPTGLTEVNGILFYAANSNGAGVELWKSDGTPNGSVLVKEYQPVPPDRTRTT